MTVTIRPATEADAPSLSHICLLTGNAGTSAEHLHSILELPGLVYAVPYVKLPTTFGFVMVDEDTSEVVGYTLGSKDSQTFEREADVHWYPPLRAKYPLDGSLIDSTEADERYIRLFHKMDSFPSECVAFSPAHLHIDILPAYQRQGWGRRLIDEAVRHLRGHGLDGVWLGMDPKNLTARGFYERLGFKDIGPPGYMGLTFDDWNSF